MGFEDSAPVGNISHWFHLKGRTLSLSNTDFHEYGAKHGNLGGVLTHFAEIIDACGNAKLVPVRKLVLGGLEQTHPNVP